MCAYVDRRVERESRDMYAYVHKGVKRQGRDMCNTV